MNFDLENYEKRNESGKMLSDIYEERNRIGYKYIPKCNFNFYLDLESLSYKPSIKLDSYKELFQLFEK